jgi:hypothetical protein
MQRSLLVALVTLELALASASAWLAYSRLVHVIDANMYRMHVAQTGPTLMRFAEEGFAVLGLFAVVNVIALAIAAGIWSYRENLVLRDFTGLIGKTRELDFSSDALTPRKHEVLALAATWRARERTRFTAIREQVTKLEAAVSTEATSWDTRNAVESLNRLLS